MANYENWFWVSSQCQMGSNTFFQTSKNKVKKLDTVVHACNSRENCSLRPVWAKSQDLVWKIKQKGWRSDSSGRVQGLAFSSNPRTTNKQTKNLRSEVKIPSKSIVWWVDSPYNFHKCLPLIKGFPSHFWYKGQRSLVNFNHWRKPN
jgi:hypothetical protein